jgi:hypothetical protein
MPSFQFSVAIWNNNRSINPATVPEQVIQWYMDSAPDEYELTNMKIRHVTGSVFEATCDFADGQEDKNSIECFIDNDEDGNHLLRVLGGKFLVMGQLTSYNGISEEE